MKYAITDPRGRIYRVVAEEPTNTPHYAPITEEQAQQIEASQGPLFILDGELLTLQQRAEHERLARKAAREAERFAADPEAAKQAKRQEIAQARYEAETAGTTFNGIPLRTDEKTQVRLGQAAFFASQDPNFTTDWKLADGQFIALNAATITAMSEAVLTHVKVQFTREKELNALIDTATTAQELNAIVWATP